MAQKADPGSNGNGVHPDSEQKLPDYTKLPEEGAMATHDYQELPRAGIWRGLGNVGQIAGLETLACSESTGFADFHHPRQHRRRLPE